MCMLSCSYVTHVVESIKSIENTLCLLEIKLGEDRALLYLNCDRDSQNHIVGHLVGTSLLCYHTEFHLLCSILLKRMLKNLTVLLEYIHLYMRIYG